MGLIPLTVALDSNVFIAALSGDETYSGTAQKIIQNIQSGQFSAIYSVIVLAEVRGSGTNLNREVTINGFFGSLANSRPVVVDTSIANLAGGLRQQYAKLRLPDAIHLATALDQKAGLFITNDLTLAKIAKGIVPTKTLADYQKTPE